ncbi:MAG: undecaprenyl-diphosphate phosphatase [Firmicutes bacterium]|nr:undecaprenyl-diphosphate phosphatase [Bacillota bacterium]
MWVSVVALGVMQGLTEFLPISSSGHLILLRTLFHLASAGAQWEVALHLGTLLAVVWVYRQWIREWAVQLVRKDGTAWRLMWGLVVASVPAGIVGFGLGHWLEQLYIVQAAALGWLCTAVLLWVTPSAPKPEKGRSLDQLTLWDAWLVGLAQALSLWPGLSRSGSTIAMARALGLDGESAAQFSFLMAIPAVLGATAFEWPQAQQHGLPWTAVLVGVLVAAISGMIAIQWVRKVVQHRWAWRGFSAYLVGLAVAALRFGG